VHTTFSLLQSERIDIRPVCPYLRLTLSPCADLLFTLAWGANSLSLGPDRQGHISRSCFLFFYYSLESQDILSLTPENQKDHGRFALQEPVFCLCIWNPPVSAHFGPKTESGLLTRPIGTLAGPSADGAIARHVDAITLITLAIGSQVHFSQWAPPTRRTAALSFQGCCSSSFTSAGIWHTLDSILFLINVGYLVIMLPRNLVHSQN
jgi:hypothetical protein